MSTLSEYEKIQLQDLMRQKKAIEQTLEKSHIDTKKIMSQIDLKAIKSATQQAVQYANMISASYTNYISEEVERISKIDLPQIPNHIQEIAQTIAHSTKLFLKNLSESNPKVKDSIETMINIGWYPDIEDFEMSALIDFKDLLTEYNIDAIDTLLVEYYKEKLLNIVEYLISKHPHRKSILNAAFVAHNQGNYILSIPVFFTQIDGIAMDLFSQNYFQKQRGGIIPKTSLAIEKSPWLNDFSLALLIPLQSSQPLIYSEKERGENFKQLNRHQVLHGESSDYGTETNSYKAISLLLYISQAAEIVNRNHNGSMR